MRIATYTHAGVTSLGELQEDVAVPFAGPLRSVIASGKIWK